MTESSVNEYRLKLLRLIQELTDDNLTSLIHQYRVPEKQKGDAIDFFRYLENNQELSENDQTRFVESLRLVNSRLVEILTGKPEPFNEILQLKSQPTVVEATRITDRPQQQPAPAARNRRRSSSPNPPEERVFTEYEMKIIEQISTDWEHLGLYLKIGRERLRNIKYENPRRCKDCAVELVSLWIQKEGDQANIDVLLSALAKIPRKDIVDEIKEMQKKKKLKQAEMPYPLSVQESDGTNAEETASFFQKMNVKSL